MIICAAVKFQIVGGNEVVIPCLRHHHAYEIMRDLGFKPLELNRLEEGFIDHKNNFLNREEAYRHAIDCGQLSAIVRNQKNMANDDLFSEDLY